MPDRGPAAGGARSRERVLETLIRLSRVIAVELDLRKLLQAVTDAGAELTGARHGAFFYRAPGDQTHAIRATYGSPDAFAQLAMPESPFGSEATVRIADATRDPRVAPRRGESEDPAPVRSYLAAPVRLRSGEVVGGVLCGHPDPDVFDEQAERLLEGVALQAAIAIEHVRLHQTTRSEVRSRRRDEARLAAEHAVTRILTESESLEEAAPRCLDAIRNALAAEVAELWLLAESGTELVRRVVIPQRMAPERSPFEAVSQHIRFARGAGLPGRVWETGRPAWIAELATDGNFPRAREAVASGLHSGFAFPVHTRDAFFGVMEFFLTARTEPDPALLRMMASLGSEIGQFIRRKQAEAVAREREIQSRAMLETAIDCIVTMDADGRILEFNPAAERTFGHRRKDVIGRLLAEVIVPERLREGHRRGLQRFVETGAERILGKRIELPALRADGSEFPCELTVTCARVEPSRPFFTGYLRDITERKRAEQDLRRFKFISDHANDAHFLLRRDTHFLYVNEVACERLGYDESELLALRVPDIDPSFPVERVGLLFDSLARGRVDPFETRLRRKDGTQFPAEISVTGVAFDGERFMFAVARDITERKRAEQALQERTAQLAEADRRKDEFLALLAHELRNPLAPIQSSVDLMRAVENERDPASRSAVEVIGRQTSQLARLVDDLLDVARITHGRIQLRPEIVSLREVVAHAEDTARQAVRSKNHTLHLSPPPDDLFVRADMVRLVQVVANVLDNAAKYTPPGGSIWLVARREGEDAVIRVRDTGRGIPASSLPHVFDAFHQDDRGSLARVQGGLGLGLSIVRGIVEGHGGSVEARSEGEGKGSEFVIRLPARAAEERRPVAEAASRRSPETPRRILVVDDHRDARESLAVLLARKGHAVETAADGESALEVATRFAPEVVLLDIGLPGMDGYEVARRLRHAGDRSLLLALSGYGQDRDRARSAEAGFDYHLLKPIRYESLRKILEGDSD